jgi:hypothetical protein
VGPSDDNTSPVSSRVSRTTASRGVSPGSMAPAGRFQCPAVTFTSSTRPASSRMTAAETGISTRRVPTRSRSPRMYGDIGTIGYPRSRDAGRAISCCTASSGSPPS